MKFCPECGAQLITQKFCQECGANIGNYLNNKAEQGGLNDFDLSEMEKEAQRQLEEENLRKSFYEKAIVEGTTLVRYEHDEKHLIIPEGIEKLVNGSLAWGTSIERISIPQSVSSIEPFSLYSPTLKEINVHPNNKWFKSIDGVLYTKDEKTIVTYPAQKQGSFSMPGTVTSIYEHSFQGCRGLESITLSKQLREISVNAFCSSALKSISIPSTVKFIQEGAFGSCESLVSVEISGEIIGRSAFSCCSNLTYLRIDEGVKSIGEKAFSQCRSLVNVTFPNTLNSIGVSAFDYCISLASIVLPSSLRNIGENAFSGCEKLTSINVPGGVAEIRERIFAYCGALQSISIEEGVTAIDKNCFTRCANIKSIRLPYSIRSVHEDAFGCSGIRDIYIPRGKKSITSNWDPYTVLNYNFVEY